MHLIGLDWGISSLRGYLMDGDGRILDTVSNRLGILHREDRAFEEAFEESVGHWMDDYPEAPMITCGMIGSRQGWFEVPYLPCPVGFAEFANHLSPLETTRGRKLWFVPGIMYRAEDNTPDVIRGEETQILGGIQSERERCLFVLPGTHSKWAVVMEGRITAFSTYMTGELFAVLCDHSILGRLMEDGPDDEAAFLKGVACAVVAAKQGRGVMDKLFSARSLGLFNEVAATNLRSYLSGILIGGEVAEATVKSKEGMGLRLIGDSRLSMLYSKALDQFGWSSEILTENLAAHALFSIAKSARLL